MNREEKLRLILEDDKIRKMEEQNNLLRIRQVVNSPSVASNTIEDDFQYTEVEVGERDKTVYEYNVDPQKALVIEYIGNDWYPGIEYELMLDDESVLGKIQREIAPTNNPKKTSYIVRESVVWRASNLESQGATEARDLGVVTGGKLIPVDYYDMLADLYNETGFFVPRGQEELITMGDFKQ